MNTLADWINAHPHVDPRQFEQNYLKTSGTGEYEYTCGFCLASHFSGENEPELCCYCAASFRETRSISDLEDVGDEVWKLVEDRMPQEADYFLLKVMQDSVEIGWLRVASGGLVTEIARGQFCSMIRCSDAAYSALPIHILIGPLETLAV